VHASCSPALFTFHYCIHDYADSLLALHSNSISAEYLRLLILHAPFLFLRLVAGEMVREQSWGTSPPELINLVQDEANFARTLAICEASSALMFPIVYGNITKSHSFSEVNNISSFCSKQNSINGQSQNMIC
jgi:hypothetical protein